WTTTPWTIPVNQALAYGPEIEYVLLNVVWGDRTPMFLVAEQLVGPFLQRLGLPKPNDPPVDGKSVVYEPIFVGGQMQDVIKGADLAGTIARHPIYTYLRHSGESGNPVASDGAESLLGPRFRGDDEKGGMAEEAWERALEFYAAPRPFLPGEFVTTDSGTGLVHMSPDHGEDDFELCKAHGIDPVFAVEGDGKYREDWLWLGGQGSVINNKFNAPDGPICSDLREAGALLAASADYQHSYPHSWRSKAKVIYRCTPQWFVSMDKALPPSHCAQFVQSRWENEGGAIAPPAALGPTLRQLAINAISATRW